MLAISAMAAEMLVAIDTTALVHKVVLTAYAFGMAIVAAKAFRWS